MWTQLSIFALFLGGLVLGGLLGRHYGRRDAQKQSALTLSNPLLFTAQTIAPALTSFPRLQCPPSCGQYGPLVEELQLLQYRQRLYCESLEPWQQALRSSLQNWLALMQNPQATDSLAVQQQAGGLLALVEELQQQLHNLSNQHQESVFEWSTLVHQTQQLFTPHGAQMGVSIWTTGSESELPLFHGDNRQIQGLLMGILQQGLTVAESVLIIDTCITQKTADRIWLQVQISADGTARWPSWSLGLLERLARLGGRHHDGSQIIANKLLHSRRFLVPLNWRHHRPNVARWSSTFAGYPIGLLAPPIVAQLLERQFRAWGMIVTLLDPRNLPSVLPPWLVVDRSIALPLPITGRRLDLCHINELPGPDITLYKPLNPQRLRQGLLDCLQSSTPTQRRHRGIVVGLDFAQSQLLGVLGEQLGWQLTLHDGHATPLDSRLWGRFELVIATEPFFDTIRTHYHGPLILLISPMAASLGRHFETDARTASLTGPLISENFQVALRKLDPAPTTRCLS